MAGGFTLARGGKVIALSPGFWFVRRKARHKIPTHATLTSCVIHCGSRIAKSAPRGPIAMRPARLAMPEKPPVSRAKTVVIANAMAAGTVLHELVHNIVEPNDQTTCLALHCLRASSPGTVGRISHGGHHRYSGGGA